MWPGRTRRTPNLWMTSVSTHLSTSVVGAHCMIWLMALSTSFCTSIYISIALTYSSSHSCVLLVCCSSVLFLSSLSFLFDFLYCCYFYQRYVHHSLLWLLSNHLLWIISVNYELCLLFTVIHCSLLSVRSVAFKLSRNLLSFSAVPCFIKVHLLWDFLISFLSTCIDSIYLL